jgi:hypothetical protein
MLGLFLVISRLFRLIRVILVISVIRNTQNILIFINYILYFICLSKDLNSIQILGLSVVAKNIMP